MAKYCINDECPEFQEYGVRGEYRDDIQVCPVCSASLSSELSDPDVSGKESVPDINLAIVARFHQRYEAELVKALLEDHGIKASILSDDCGGAHPAMGFCREAHIVVEKKDYEEAIAILEKGKSLPDDEMDQ
jgi:hypothetical protein